MSSFQTTCQLLATKKYKHWTSKNWAIKTCSKRPSNRTPLRYKPHDITKPKIVTTGHCRVTKSYTIPKSIKNISSLTLIKGKGITWIIKLSSRKIRRQKGWYHRNILIWIIWWVMGEGRLNWITITTIIRAKSIP